MGIANLLWSLAAVFIMLAFGGALVLLSWWLWRKITLPEGALPPKLGDLSGLREGAGRAPIVIRLLVVAVLGLMMSAPVGLIHGLIKERAESYESVVEELSYSWGGQQLLIGPVLSIPYTIRYIRTEEVALSEAEMAEGRWAYTDNKTKTVQREVTAEKTAVLLPEELYVDGFLEPQERKRGIYAVRVYTAALALKGSFKRPDFSKIDSSVSQVHWDRASILVNLSDTKAFRDISPLRLNGLDHKFVPGTGNSSIVPTGFSAEADLSGEGDIEFGFEMEIGGSRGFYVSPIAVESVVTLKSPWPHPKYGGTGLPSRHETGETGFSAVWEVPSLVRNYPQFFDDAEFMASGTQKTYGGPDVKSPLRLAEYVVGLDFFEPVFHYSLLNRAVKYAMMFIALTFLSVLVFEAAAGGRYRARLHLAQYGIIGLGLSLFYLVLLAAAEHLPFVLAYILAAGVNVLMIGGYVLAALRRGKGALLVSGILTALYSALYLILRMEEYSLVSGAALLVAAMAALMYVTRNLGRETQDFS